jgi:hypothetical protein
LENARKIFGKSEPCGKKAGSNRGNLEIFFKKLYRFAKSPGRFCGAVCCGGRISASDAVVIGAVQTDGGGEGGDIAVVQSDPFFIGAVIEDIKQTGAVGKAAFFNGDHGCGDIDGIQRQASGEGVAFHRLGAVRKIQAPETGASGKASGPMDTTVSGSRMVVSSAHPEKQPGARAVTVWPSTVSGTRTMGEPSQHQGRKVTSPSEMEKQPSSASGREPGTRSGGMLTEWFGSGITGS